MASNCCMVGCSADKSRNRGLSFHRIRRTKDKEWEQKLIRCVSRSDKSFNPATAAICSRHFEPSCFVKGNLSAFYRQCTRRYRGEGADSPLSADSYYGNNVKTVSFWGAADPLPTWSGPPPLWNCRVLGAPFRNFCVRPCSGVATGGPCPPPHRVREKKFP